MARWSRMACPMMLVATCLAGCGSSHHPASKATGTVASATAAGRASASGGIRSQVLTNNELAGFRSEGVTVYASLHKWISSSNDQQTAAQAAAEKAMLTHEGFKAGAVENLNGPAPDAGVSIVEQLRSATAARAALAFYISRLKQPKAQATDGTYAPFKVPGVPGAVGFTLGGAAGGANIGFTRGAYYYLVGREGATSRDRAGLTAAARHLYRRVGG